MKRIVMSLGMIVFVAAVVAGGTGAFFSDSESSTGNVFTAGSVTLSLENIIHNGNNSDELVGFSATEDQTGFSFAFADLKPLDAGEVSFDLLNGANEAYVCARVLDQGGADNTVVNPEADLGDDDTEGELDQFLSFAFDGSVGTIADASGQWTELVTSPVAANDTTDASFAYCFGEFDGSSCVLGDGEYNLAQTDSLTADVEFYAVQTRNNGGFSCDSLNDDSDDYVIASSYGTGFEQPDFTLGNVNGQDGWSKTGPFDVEVVDDPAIDGLQSLRISNAITSGSFGDQTFAPELASGAGETGVATENRFEAEFEISSTDLAEQSGLSVSVSPDDGLGSRMSFLRFSDEAGGIRVTFFDVNNPGPLPTGSTFVPADLGLLDRSTSHTIKFVMDFVDGPGNDVVEIYINGALAHTGTTWEDYYRYDPEQNGNGNQLFAVDTLIFQTRGTAAPGTSGGGYVFDNVSLSSGSI